MQAIAEHTGVFSHALGGEVYGMHTGQELRNWNGSMEFKSSTGVKKLRRLGQTVFMEN